MRLILLPTALDVVFWLHQLSLCLELGLIVVLATGGSSSKPV